jgi:conjugal transfer/entry exclusion protein
MRPVRYALLALALSAVFAPRIARAQAILEVISQEQQEAANLAQILSTLKEANTLTQQALTGRPLSEVGYALGVLKQTQNDYQALVGSTASMGYDIKSIHATFANLYPDTPGIQAIPAAQFDTLNTQEQTEVLAASEIADRSQTSVELVETQSELASTILQNSSGLDTIAGQLQLGMQLASVMQANFTAQIQNLAMSGRVLSDDAAAQAAGQQMAHERTRRNRLNYTARGVAVGIPNAMP